MSNKDVITEDLQLLFGDCLERMKEIPDGRIVTGKQIGRAHV